MRLIDADALMKFITEQAETPTDEIIASVCRGAALSMPAVEAVPVVHGMWEEIRNPYGTLEGWIHRDCGRETKIKDTYCPNCGAKMDGERKDP